MPVTAMAIGAGVGLLKSQLVDKPKEDRQRQLQASLEKYSPWTHQQGDMSQVKVADPFGSALQYGATGGAMQQNAEMAKYMKDNPWNTPKLNFNYNSGGGGGGYDLANNPWSGFNGPNPYSSGG